MKFEALQRLFSTIYIFSYSMLWNANTREQIQNPLHRSYCRKEGDSGTKNLTNIDR